MAEYNKVYASLKPELPKVIQQEQIYVYAPRSSRAGMKSITGFNITAPVASVQYDTTDGITVIGDSSLVSEEVSGEKLTQNFQSEFRVPIRPGKYINIDATADNDAVELKADEAQLALDFYKINKTSTQSVPAYSPSKGRIDIPCSFSSTRNTLVQRGLNGEAVFNWILFDSWKKVGSSASLEFNQLWRQCGSGNGYVYIEKTSTDTGTMSTDNLYTLRYMPKMNIVYDHQEYYRMDPVFASDSTISYIHIDSIQDGSGGYKAIVKCFSITVSTRAWKVFDLDFGGSGNGIDSIETLNLAHELYSGDVYGGKDGQMYNAKSTIQYRDAATNKVINKVFYSTVHIPMVGSDYVQITGDAANNRFVIRLNDENMSQDYIKIDKTRDSVVPQYVDGKTAWTTVTSAPTGSTIVSRAGDGSTYVTKLFVNRFATTAGEYDMPLQAVYYGGWSDGFTVEKTPTDTGTLTSTVLDAMRAYPNAGLKYNNQSYIRMDPISAPDGTLNYIHLDSIQNGSSGYTMTGKCFSVTVSTRAWQVVSLSLTKSYTHQICISNAAANTKYYFTLINNKSASYHGNAAGLINALSDTDTEFQPATRSHATNGVSAALLYRSDQGYLVAQYGTNTEQMTANQIVVWDNVI
uniref:Uncharacterized protein n=1 Tax=Siphoviridae sp. ctv4j104 TaxID=2826510 RepID=A0A8S5MAQ5_9CAUD|nr:MAG TPA: hypothetical protein [Siphoviridae sp. ctv4j104]